MADTKPVGRPPKGDEPNNIKVTVRISRKLDKKVQAYADNHGLTKPEAIREALGNLPD